MDFDEAKFMYSRRLNNQRLIVHSARIAGSVFKFHKKDETHFACSCCKSLGKNRVLTVETDEFVICSIRRSSPICVLQAI